MRGGARGTVTITSADYLSPNSITVQLLAKPIRFLSHSFGAVFKKTKKVLEDYPLNCSVRESEINESAPFLKNIVILSFNED